MKYRLAICHVPFVEHFEYPFDVASEIYEEWTELLGEMGIDLLLAGHMHRAYFVPARTPEKRNAAFPTAVCSIPSVKGEDGEDFYVGGLLEFSPERRTAQAVPLPEVWEF